MANVNAPKGFIPVMHANGSAWSGKTNMYLIPATDSTAVFVGDIVKNAGSAGTAGQTVNGIDVEGIQTAALATAGTTGQDILGVVVGFLPYQSDLTIKHRQASVARIALVADPVDTIFEVQEDAATTPIVAASIGLNVAYSTTAGSATTGMSAMEIVSTSVATTATLPLKLLGLVKRPDNAFNTGGAATDKAKFLVRFNTHQFAPNVAGA